MRKFSSARKLYGSLIIVQALVSGGLAIGGIISFIFAMRGKYLTDNIYSNYVAGLFALGLSFIAALVIPELRDRKNRYSDEILTLEERINNSKKSGGKNAN